MVGKAVIEEVCARELDRQSQGKTPVTRVVDKTVNIDRYSTMDVSQAIRVFEYQTLCEIAGDIRNKLDLTAREIVGADQFKIEGQVSGYFQALAHQFKTAFKVKTQCQTPS